MSKYVPQVGDRVRYQYSGFQAVWHPESFTGTVQAVNLPGVFGDPDIRVRRDNGTEVRVFASELTLIDD